MTQLHPCPSCHRHLQARESLCPFCGARVAARVDVIAAALVGAALAAQACESTSTPLYGIPPMDQDAGVTDGGGS